MKHSSDAFDIHTGSVFRPGETIAMTKHNFDRPLADDVGNIVGAMCSRCGKTTKLDGGDIPDATKNEDCEPEGFSQASQGSASRPSHFKAGVRS